MTQPNAALRRPAIELGRLAAAFGIVMAHARTGDLGWIGQLALAFFVILTAYLSAQSFARAPDSHAWTRRAWRILVTWLFWSALFRLVLWKISDPPIPLLHVSDWWSLLSGSAYHLWFLPFVIVAMAMVRPVGGFLNSDRRLIGALVAVVAVSFGLFTAHEHDALPMPLTQWAAMLPAYLWALLWAIADRRGHPGWAAAGLVGLTLAGIAATGGQAFWPVTIALAAAGVGALWHLPLPGAGRLWAAAGQISFGVYLVHPLMLLVGYKMIGANADPILLGLFAFALSALTAIVMLRLPVARRLV